MKPFALLMLVIWSIHCLCAQSWTNPILPQRADPHVLLHKDGWYYLTATVPEYDRIELRRSKLIGGLSSAKARRGS